jgi:hypothetical protein
MYCNVDHTQWHDPAKVEPDMLGHNRFLAPILAIALLLPAALALAADDTQAKIETLEKKWKSKPGEFDWGVHNDLRHLYGGRDVKKMLLHCNIIFRNSPMDGYTLDCLGARAPDKAQAIKTLLELAKDHPEYTFLALACWLKAAELEGYATPRGKELLQKVAGLEEKEVERYRAIANAKLEDISRPVTKAPWTIPVLVIHYFPLTADKQNIDIKVTSNVGAPVKKIEEKCRQQTKEVVHALEEGSRFRAYKNPNAKPSMKYVILDSITFYEPVPHHPKKKNYTDYNKIMERVNIRDWVEKQGVREVWIWGYHSKEIGPVESNMASVHGNVSNSHRDPFDLPICKHTYTVYHYNYERGTDMAVHNHLHQIEAVMRQHGGDLWKTFEGKPGAWRCGNCHFPVNGRRDYDYANKEYVESDIEDWKPEGFGQKQKMNCDKWGGDDLRWYVYWMQSIPGADSGLTYQGRPLSNWWEYLGDYDQAVKRKTKLVD